MNSQNLGKNKAGKQLSYSKGKFPPIPKSMSHVNASHEAPQNLDDEEDYEGNDDDKVEEFKEAEDENFEKAFESMNLNENSEFQKLAMDMKHNDVKAPNAARKLQDLKKRKDNQN